MRERTAQILKIICIGLAALVIVQLVKVGLRINPLAGVSIPAVPSLAADTNAPPATVGQPVANRGTNAIAANSTNRPAIAQGTNRPQAASTNVAVVMRVETNVVINQDTNAKGSFSAPVAVAFDTVTNVAGTNLAISPSTNTVVADTNAPSAKRAGGSNIVSSISARTNLTNGVMARGPGAPPPNMAGMSGMMPGMMGGPGGRKPASLAPDVQARVDRVVESELLAPIAHPMPMALLGIAGQVAFLRSPSGQTGMVKEGDNLGEIKLLRIGTNRVLVEQDGQKKELMIFSGLGGESLLPKTTDETTKH